MKSIFGAWQLDQIPFAPGSVQNVICETAWWKPDFREHHHCKNVFLGSQAAAASQCQPMQSCQKNNSRLHIVTDARLDNRKSLCSSMNISDPAISDSQLILEAYKRFGKNCVKHFVGAFAFVIFDEQRQQLFCARDHMGVKPFNYYFHQNIFAFGTQKKSILALNGIDKTADWRYILNQLSGLGIPPDSTEYLHIKKLPPAHFMLVSSQGLLLQRYWELDIHQKTFYKNEADYIEHFRELFRQAIQDRIPETAPVGTHLSGGLDSSGITAFAHEICKTNGQQLHAFTYGVPRDFKADDMKFAEENLLAFDLADFCQLENFHNITTPISRSFREKIEQETIACDGFSRSNNVNTEYEIQAAAQARNVNIMLSGFPGDELVTSFCRPFYLEYLERKQLVAYFLQKKKSRHSFKKKLKALVATQSVRWFPQLSGRMSQWYITQREKGKKYIAEFPVVNKDYFNKPELASFLEKQIFPESHQHFPVSLKDYQRNHICRPHNSRRMESETLAGLRFKVAYRYPMADIRLLQYVLSLPVEQKISADMSRRIFRLSMKNYLPDSIRLRDVKTNGSLKPMMKIHPLDPNENSKNGLWETIKKHNAAPFLNTVLIDKYFSTKRSPYRFYNWMLLGQLGVEKKLHY